MRYPDKMERPLGDDDRRWLMENNMGHVARQFDEEDGVEIEERDYSDLTASQLKDEIERRNREILAEDPDAQPISTDGKKADLIQRLKDDDAAIASS